MTLLTAHPASPPNAAPARRLRVLVGCYTMSPVRGSEPGMGWNICRAVAARHDLTVLTAAGVPGWEPADVYRREIEAYTRDHGPVPGLTIHYVDRPWWSHLWQRERELFRRTLYYSGYASWQRAAYRAGRDLHARRPFDVAHHLNMTGYREPGYLWRLPVPFVWGPVDGAANVPAAYLRLMGGWDRAFYAARTVANEAQKRLSPRPRAAARRAARVWVVGEANRRMVADLWGQVAVPQLEGGTAPRPEARVRARDVREPLRVVWSGLHVGRKALPILFDALVRLGADAGRVDVTVLGDGPETARWKAMADAAGVGPRVRWAGRVPQADALAEMNRADVLVSTSVQEATSLVVTEALSLAMPVVCHDACGMGVAVTDACGIKVPMADPAASAAGYAAALKRLADDPDLLGRLSAGALRRAGELTWDALGAAIARGYEHAYECAHEVADTAAPPTPARAAERVL